MRALSCSGGISDYFAIVGMHIIIGMPPHIIIIGAPMAIIDCMASQRSFMRGIIEGSIGIIFIIMPSFVISQDILHIIGIMPLIIMGIIMPMPPIIGIMPFMPFIIGIMPFIVGIIGIMPFMPFIIGIMPFIPPFMLFIGMGIIWPFIMGIAFMASSSIGRRSRPAPYRTPSPRRKNPTAAASVFLCLNGRTSGRAHAVFA